MIESEGGEEAVALFDAIMKMNERDSSIRGRVLLTMINLEVLVDAIIANHFCAEKEQALFTFAILRSLSFSKKLEVLNAIMRHSYADLYGEASESLKKLRKAAELRNKLAHSAPNYDHLENFAEDKIVLTTYEQDKAVPFTLGTKEVYAQMAQLSEAYYFLDSALRDIRRRQNRLK